jgi:hypothetical protein
MKQLSITTPIVISFCVGLGIVRPHLETFAAAPASVTKIDFDRVRRCDTARRSAR